MLNVFLKAYFVLVLIFSVLALFIVFKSKKRSQVKFILVFLGLIILPAIGGYFYTTYFAYLPEVSVPDLRGKTIVEAENILTQINLKAVNAGSVFDDQMPVGLVVSQRPEINRKVKIGRVISIFTSSGKRKVIVPNLLGRPLDQATEVLSNTGLNLGNVVLDYVADMDPGMVLSQDPLPGASAEAGSVVEIAVSTNEAIDNFVIEDTQQPQPDKPVKKGGFWPWL